MKMEKKNASQSSGATQEPLKAGKPQLIGVNSSSSQLPHVGVEPKDLAAVKLLISKWAHATEGKMVVTSKHEAHLMNKYFADYSASMMRDLWVMTEDLKKSPAFVMPELTQEQLLKMTVAPPLKVQQWSPETYRESALNTKLGGSAPSAPPIFSPTIDDKTFELPRLWWLRPWSTVALLGGRLETLADMYDKDMRKVVTKLDAADRAVLKAYGKAQNSAGATNALAKFRNGLLWISGQRPHTKNGSVGRKMVEVAEDLLTRFPA